MNRKLKIGLVAIILAAIWVFGAPLLATNLILEKPLDHADAILVLSGSAVYKERTRKAAELYKQGVAPIVIVTNDGTRAGWLSGEQKNPRYVELEQRELLANGVMPDSIVVLAGEVSGTDDEARAVISEIDARQIRSLLLVTSAYHTRRSLRTFEKIVAGKEVAIGVVAVPPGDRTPGAWYWYLTPRGWQTVAGEYVKIAVYWAYY